VEEVARHFRRDSREIEAWEAGSETPTYGQLEELAYRLYKRPLAVFFLPQPPPELGPEQKFRTLPYLELQQLSADTRYRLREAHAFQISLSELNDGTNPVSEPIFRKLAASQGSDIRAQASDIRKLLGIPLSAQLTWQTPEEALKAWRNAVEESGVFVFKHAFKQKAISGFCLLDREFPVIYLNNSAAKTRQIFSLFHELAHLLLNVDAISKFDQSYANRLPPQERRVEQYCNALAAECLIPSDDFDLQMGLPRKIDGKAVRALADRYSVSREAVLRRMLDRGLVDKSYYEDKAREWASAVTEGDSGGNYYATHAAYLGERYLALVFGKLYQGRLSIEQAADYLGVRTKSMAGLEALLLRRAVSA
jgi:Zn-dependent peptidase ImmA (M78 family)